MELLKLEKLTNYIDELVVLLCDSVDSGASIGFLPPMSELEAKGYWMSVQENMDAHNTILLIVKNDGQVIGSVQLSLSSKSNALHRCEIEKLMVLSDFQRQGVATLLMQGAEKVAAAWQRELIVLDTRTDDNAYHLYKKLGYKEAGDIPNYAKSASGDFDSTTIFYKEISTTQEVI
ncbi:GNAT family N-acetyltransferase [Marinomonas agarivorans]|nr:GNAT family N-acetyltransferase [Marinomonas agarivorans]